MGVNLREIIPAEAKRVIEVKHLAGNVIAIDAYNALYQFLTAIRQPDGTPLMDREGRITSHLSGLFYRTINLVEDGVKPVYVFDGKTPEMKKREVEERLKRKMEAAEKYRRAVEVGDVEEARKFAMMAARLSSDMVEESKELLDAMGIPWVQAPAEGEAQAAYMARVGDAWAAGSQDYDSLLFGAPRLVRNITITGRRKLPGKDQYVEVRPEVIELDALLRELSLTREKLIVLAILLGTDYNPGGVKGYGPKTALRVVRGVDDPVKVLKSVRQDYEPDYLVKIYEYFLKPPVSSEYSIKFSRPDEAKIRDILVARHDFNPERVDRALERLVRAYREKLKARQSRLDLWFG